MSKEKLSEVEKYIKEKKLKVLSVIAAATVATGASSGCGYTKDENAVMYENFVNHKVEYVIIDSVLHEVEYAGIQSDNERYGTIETSCGKIVKDYPIKPSGSLAYSYFTKTEEQAREKIKPLTELPTKYYYTECECVKTNIDEKASGMIK